MHGSCRGEKSTPKSRALIPQNHRTALSLSSLCQPKGRQFDSCLGSQIFLDFEISLAFRLTQLWHLLAKTGHTAGRWRSTGVVISQAHSPGRPLAPFQRWTFSGSHGSHARLVDGKDSFRNTRQRRDLRLLILVGEAHWHIDRRDRRLRWGHVCLDGAGRDFRTAVWAGK